VLEPFRVSMRRVQCPATGSDSTIVVGTCLVAPCAQFGTQLWISLVPSPVAPVAVQEVQLSPVTTLPPSPLKSIEDGFTPDQPLVIRIGVEPAGLVLALELALVTDACVVTLDVVGAEAVTVEVETITVLVCVLLEPQPAIAAAATIAPKMMLRPLIARATLPIPISRRRSSGRGRPCGCRSAA
jgi:hypothetical protein